MSAAQPAAHAWSVIPAAEKRPFIQRLFTQIAPRYDWFNRLASAGLDQRWRRQALRLGGVEPTHRVLDVCAGTGDLALLCAGIQRGRGLTAGIDMNQAMLVRAREKSVRQDRPVGWFQGDAEALPFATGSFDRVVIGFSTRNLNDLDAGLREMVRVLRRGGRLIILETGRPAHPLLRAGYQLFLYTVVRAIGFVLTGRLWPFTYLAKSVRQFLTPQQMAKRLQDAQTTVEYVPLSHGLASLFLATKA
jgi:demethylmenaquinone methyltransferase/2-methoxy-6-polyprenyl-1,4-benzoquinol methylase